MDASSVFFTKQFDRYNQVTTNFSYCKYRIMTIKSDHLVPWTTADRGGSEMLHWKTLNYDQTLM
ncbi:MAG: hypothetical protein HRU38_11000 [Saccharospirillaceae bacterium]|nr:hypothetical protein [Saccharospirillaceae bacterium]